MRRASSQLHNDLLAKNDGQYDGIADLFAEPDAPLSPLDKALGGVLNTCRTVQQCEDGVAWPEVSVFGVQIPRGTYPALQRNASITRDFRRAIPKPVVVIVHVNGHPARALIDTGSLADFMSLTTAEQIKCKLTMLEKPLTIQLAVQGSRSKVNYGTQVQFQYQGADYARYFDIINLQHYDLILGTPFLYQHSVTVGLHPSRVVLGSTDPLPLKGSGVTMLESRAVEVFEDRIERTRAYLKELARPLCAKASETALPPLRAINHTILLIDEAKIYPWRPSRCPEPMRSQWSEKRRAYLASGRWQMTSTGNTVPMLFIRKPGTDRLRTVVDLRERNKNTRKLTSPLPDMEGILRRVARKKYRSLMDGQDAYEQIRVIPEHVQHTAMTTPDGNMVSHVLQQGDCNAPATYQAVMNYLFGEYIGIFMDVYLDDIIIYSDTLEDHVEHVRKIVSILEREQLFLSEKKLKFLQPEMRILGRVVNNDGIRMDPDKVDKVLNWKPPTNRDLCRGFIGAVGYLADDIHNVRIPLGVLSAMCGDTVPFRWDETEQRAFSQVKQYVAACSDHHRVPLTYGPNQPQVWLMTDACPTGVGGVIAQGQEWRDAQVAAFYSAKLNAAQRNYPVHEQEMLAGVETMLRHRDILQGCPFIWLTDHKSLIHLLSQKSLSGRQARWMEKLGEFDFTVEYLPGEHNVLPDALSRMYDFDAPGTVRAVSEYVTHDDCAPTTDASELVSMPVLVGAEAEAFTPRRSARVAMRDPHADWPKEKRELWDRVAAGHVVPPKKRWPQAKQELWERVVTGPPSRKPMARPTVGPETGSATKQSIGLSTHSPRNSPGNGGHRPPTALPAESGRLETSAEFAHRVKNRFVLHGPKDPSTRMEGRAQENRPLDGEISKDTAPEVIPVTYPHETELLNQLRHQYTEDPLFRKILESPKEYRNFEVKDGLVRIKLKDRISLCIPNITVGERRLIETVIDQAHSILAHLGADKTLSYLREHVWWKTMAQDVRAFCLSCKTCQRSKPPNQKPYGLLNPLPVASQPWEAIGIDFVGPLPLSKDRDGEYDSVTVIIDLLSRMVHLVPSRTNYTTKDVAELVFAEVYKHHGLPRAIISDRDVLFTSNFWTRLNKLIGVQLKLSSTYHPETDGATERANCTNTQMLRACVSPNQ